MQSYINPPTIAVAQAGSVGSGSLGDGSVQSGNIGSGQIGTFHVASGQFTGFELGSGAIVSGRIASGQIGTGHLANAAVTSGDIASGSVDLFHLASGAVARAAAVCVPFQSGIVPLITEEIISGVRAVNISQSGTIRIAMASVSGRMPAVGVVFDNVAVGINANVYTQGAFQLSSGMADYSGWLGKPVWVGRSGQIVQWSGAFNSGGLNVASGGDFIQRIGIAVNSGAILVNAVLDVGQTQLLGVTAITDVDNRGFGV